MTGKLGVREDFMTGMVMCARTPLFLTTYGGSEVEIQARETLEIREKSPPLNAGPRRRRLRGIGECKKAPGSVISTLG